MTLQADAKDVTFKVRAALRAGIAKLSNIAINRVQLVSVQHSTAAVIQASQPAHGRDACTSSEDSAPNIVSSGKKLGCSN